MREKQMRLTQPALKILRLFSEHSANTLSGAEIAKATGASSGTLYPLLARLENTGWATSTWEEIDPREARRPRRRLYKLTALGRARAHAALAELQIQASGGFAWNV